MGIYSIFSNNNSFGTNLIIFCAWIVAVLFAIIIHEYSHAWTANRMGDPTAKNLGRLSFNPARHLDPFGTLCLFLFGFGWAKSVPINPNLFRNYKKGQILVSISGVLTNLCLGVIFTFLSVISTLFFDTRVTILFFLNYFFYFCAIINYVLAIFNILPIYPLDGFSLLSTFLPYDNKFLNFMRKYGTIILLVLLISQAISYLMDFVLQVCYFDLFKLFSGIFV